ncbi:hypothetical protein PUN4_490097 [Paraburkholderia unamae]|nr:hypothetical protein PUN4_490097 [Paraburkholderia unamae]
MKWRKVLALASGFSAIRYSASDGPGALPWSGCCAGAAPGARNVRFRTDAAPTLRLQLPMLCAVRFLLGLRSSPHPARAWRNE